MKINSVNSVIDSSINFPLFFKPVDEPTDRRRVIALNGSSLLVVYCFDSTRETYTVKQGDWLERFGFNKLRYQMVPPEDCGDLKFLAGILMKHGFSEEELALIL